MRGLNRRITVVAKLSCCPTGHVVRSGKPELEYVVDCPDCGDTVIDGNFCQSCGTRLRERVS